MTETKVEFENLLTFSIIKVKGDVLTSTVGKRVIGKELNDLIEGNNKLGYKLITVIYSETEFPTTIFIWGKKE